MTETTRTPNGTRMSDAAQDALAATAQVIDSSRPTRQQDGRPASARPHATCATALPTSHARAQRPSAMPPTRHSGAWARLRERPASAWKTAPMKSVLIAAAVGAAVALVVGLLQPARRGLSALRGERRGRPPASSRQAVVAPIAQNP